MEVFAPAFAVHYTRRIASTKLSSEALWPSLAPLMMSSPTNEMSRVVTVTLVLATSDSKMVADMLMRSLVLRLKAETVTLAR
jgi:hypothetical protein